MCFCKIIVVFYVCMASSKFSRYNKLFSFWAIINYNLTRKLTLNWWNWTSWTLPTVGGIGTINLNSWPSWTFCFVSDNSRIYIRELLEWVHHIDLWRGSELGKEIEQEITLTIHRGKNYINKDKISPQAPLSTVYPEPLPVICFKPDK